MWVYWTIAMWNKPSLSCELLFIWRNMKKWSSVHCSAGYCSVTTTRNSSVNHLSSGEGVEGDGFGDGFPRQGKECVEFHCCCSFNGYCNSLAFKHLFSSSCWILDWEFCCQLNKWLQSRTCVPALRGKSYSNVLDPVCCMQNNWNNK